MTAISQSLTYVPMLSYFLTVPLFQFSCRNLSTSNLQIQYSLHTLHPSYCSLVRLKLLPGLIQKLRGTIYKYKWHRKGLKCRACHFNPLNPELNPICYLLALLGAHHFLHVSRIRVKLLTFRLLMSYTYGAPILDVSKSHTTTQHSR